jgi:bifunctional polynucleotide phosphatase/kinase
MISPEIVIMVGFPGSGKSSIAKQLCENKNYVHIEGDIYKSSSKMIKRALEYIPQNKSIIFDATNSSVKKRAEYLNFAKKHGYTARCMHVATPLDVAYKRNKTRDPEKQVPRIAYNVYSKHYEKPSEIEGFELFTIDG